MLLLAFPSRTVSPHCCCCWRSFLRNDTALSRVYTSTCLCEIAHNTRLALCITSETVEHCAKLWRVGCTLHEARDKVTNPPQRAGSTRPILRRAWLTGPRSSVLANLRQRTTTRPPASLTTAPVHGPWHTVARCTGLATKWRIPDSAEPHVFEHFCQPRRCMAHGASCALHGARHEVANPRRRTTACLEHLCQLRRCTAHRSSKFSRRAAWDFGHVLPGAAPLRLLFLSCFLHARIAAAPLCAAVTLGALAESTVRLALLASPARPGACRAPRLAARALCALSLVIPPMPPIEVLLPFHLLAYQRRTTRPEHFCQPRRCMAHGASCALRGACHKVANSRQRRSTRPRALPECMAHRSAIFVPVAAHGWRVRVARSTELVTKWRISGSAQPHVLQHP